MHIRQAKESKQSQSHSSLELKLERYIRIRKPLGWKEGINANWDEQAESYKNFSFLGSAHSALKVESLRIETPLSHFDGPPLSSNGKDKDLLIWRENFFFQHGLNLWLTGCWLTKSNPDYCNQLVQKDQSKDVERCYKVAIIADDHHWWNPFSHTSSW